MKGEIPEHFDTGSAAPEVPDAGHYADTRDLNSKEALVQHWTLVLGGLGRRLNELQEQNPGLLGEIDAHREQLIEAQEYIEEKGSVNLEKGSGGSNILQLKMEIESFLKTHAKVASQEAGK